jgi:hypothetical protein
MIGCYTVGKDYAFETLLSLDGSEFQFAAGYRIKIGAQTIRVNKNRPHGIKYSLTLHDQEGRRIYGLDNAHGIGHRADYDHRHVYGANKIIPYVYKDAEQLLEDFYREVERILKERGVK